MGRTFLFSCYAAVYRCAIIIQIMCYAVKVANPSHYIRNYRERKSTVAKKLSFMMAIDSEVALKQGGLSSLITLALSMSMKWKALIWENILTC